MRYGIYTIRDKVAEVGGYPFTSRNNQTAARVFRDFMQKQNMASVSPDDFELLRIGTFEEEKCFIEACTPTYVEVAMPPSVRSEEE